MNRKFGKKTTVSAFFIHSWYYLFLTGNNRIRGKCMKRNVGKKRLAFILVAVCLVGVIGIGISYSYYLANISTSNEENKNSNITTTTITNVVMDMQGKVSSNGAYPGHKMVKEVVVRGIGESNSLPANASIKITPDLGDFSSDVTWKLYKSDSAITCSSVEHTDGGQYYDESTCNIPASASLVLEGSSKTKYKNIVVSPNTETKYYLVVEYLNKTDIDQSSQMGKSFSIDIGIGEKTTSMSDKITDLAKTDTVNLATDDPDNNVRYIGKDPSNYVYFNCSDYANPTADTCELWRIIGVFNNVTKSDGSKENLVKIIRDESIGNYSWDSSASSVNSGHGVNDWTDADAMKLLNPGYDSVSVGGSLYYNSKSGTCYHNENNTTTSCDFTSTGLKNDTTRNAIEEVVWNLGGTVYYASVSHWYGYERGTTVYTGRPTTWTGKIGLMYPSDYGYATSGGTTKDRAACLAKELLSWNSSGFSDCKENDYLFDANDSQLTLTPNSGYANFVYLVRYSGSVGALDAYFSYTVRPALFLKSNIQVDKGTGAKSDPYTLKMQ